MKKLEITIFVILCVILSIWLTSSLAQADPVIDGFFEATETTDVTDAIGIGKDGEMIGITKLGMREFILLASLYVLSKEHYEPSQEWEVFDNGACCFGFWAGTREYCVCVKKKGNKRFVAIDRTF